MADDQKKSRYQNEPWFNAGEYSESTPIGATEEEFFEQLPRRKLDSYAERLEDWYTLERHDGIIQATIGGKRGKTPNNLNQLFLDIGNDPDNKIMILTSSDDYWLFSHADDAKIDAAYTGRAQFYEKQQRAHFLQRLRILQNLIFDVDIPTIGVLNGSDARDVHTEAAFACDITLCSDDYVERDPHTDFGLAPGDGKGLVYQELLGTKRAAFHLYTGAPLNAQKLLDYGMVNEVWPRDQLRGRAWEIAEQIRKMPAASLAMTRAIIRRPWTERLVRDGGFHLAYEFFGAFDDKAGYDGFLRSYRRSRDLHGTE